MVGTLSFSFGSNEEKNLQKLLGYLGRFETRDIVNILVYVYFYRVPYIEIVKMKWLSILSNTETNFVFWPYLKLRRK